MPINLSNFYAEDTQEVWFTRTKKVRPSVHDLLLAEGMSLISKPELAESYSELLVPFDIKTSPWNTALPVVPHHNHNTYIAHNVRSLKDIEYEGDYLFDCIERYMDLLLGKTKYLVSLHSVDYLVATGTSVSLTSICEVARQWHLECYIGLFDDSGKSCFLFDGEFETIVCSFSPDAVPAGYDRFSKYFTDEFNETFVRDARKRTGANPERAKGYYETINVNLA